MRTKFIRSIPFLLAFIAGLVVFLVAMFILYDGHLYDIFIEISGALLGVPIVFLIYDYSAYRVTKKLNKTLFSGIRFGVDTVANRALRTARRLLKMPEKMSPADTDKMLDMTVAQIRKALGTAGAARLGAGLRTDATKLMTIIYNGGNAAILDTATLENILQMARELSVLADTLEYGADRNEIAAHLQKLFAVIDEWRARSEEEVIINNA